MIVLTILNNPAALTLPELELSCTLIVGYGVLIGNIMEPNNYVDIPTIAKILSSILFVVMPLALIYMLRDYTFYKLITPLCICAIPAASLLDANDNLILMVPSNISYLVGCTL